MKYNKKMQILNSYKSEENLKKIDKIKENIQELRLALGEDAIDQIMWTYKDYPLGIKFLKFLDLHRKYNPDIITEKLNLKNKRLVEGWYRKSSPMPIKILLDIHRKGYHKISKEDLALLFGWGFGDGGLSYGIRYYFICGKKQDLLNIKDYLYGKIPSLVLSLDKNFGKSSIRQVNGKVKSISGTDSWILYARDSSFCRFLYALGMPRGNKVLQETKIPDWIMKVDKRIRKAFLTSFFEGEMQKHKVQYNVKRNKTDVCPITLGLSKIEEYKSNLIDFLNQIKIILGEFSIKTTKVEEPKPSNIRKDGFTTFSSRFYVSISAINVIRFSKLIDYPFNKEKKEALLESVCEAENKLKRMVKQIDKYKKALELYEKGVSLYKIAKELNIQYHTAKYWLKTKQHLPTLLNEDLGEVTNEAYI